VQYAIRPQLLITRVCCASAAVRSAILAAAWLLVIISNYHLTLLSLVPAAIWQTRQMRCRF